MKIEENIPVNAFDFQNFFLFCCLSVRFIPLD